MAMTVIAVNPSVKMRATALLTAVGIADVNVEFADFDRSSPSYTPTSTPPVTKVAAGTLTPGAGTVNFNLAAIADILGGTAVDFTGIKVVVALFRCPTTNAALISIAEGASNGYQIQAGQAIKIYPGGTWFSDFRDGLGDVAAGDRILDVVGTDASDSVDFFLAAG